MRCSTFGNRRGNLQVELLTDVKRYWHVKVCRVRVLLTSFLNPLMASSRIVQLRTVMEWQFERGERKERKSVDGSPRIDRWSYGDLGGWRDSIVHALILIGVQSSFFFERGRSEELSRARICCPSLLVSRHWRPRRDRSLLTTTTTTVSSCDIDRNALPLRCPPSVPDIHK